MQKFINNWSTTLTQAISATDTALTIDSNAASLLANGFQQGDYYMLTLDDGVNVEIVKVNQVSGNQLIVVRGLENTIATTWVTNTKLEMRLTALHLFKQQMILDRLLFSQSSILISPDGKALYH